MVAVGHRLQRLAFQWPGYRLAQWVPGGTRLQVLELAVPHLECKWLSIYLWDEDPGGSYIPPLGDKAAVQR